MNHLGDTNKMGKPETYLTIHADGRITVSDKLKPDETAARVLECMKTQFLGDAQATKIRELQDHIKRLESGDAALNYSIGLDLQKENDALKARIKRLEEAGDEMANAYEELERELNEANARIKQLEEAGDELLWAFCPASVSMMTERESDALKLWTKAKEAKP